MVQSHGHSDLRVFGTIIIRVSDKGCLPMVVELGIGYGDTCTTMRNIEEPIVASQKDEYYGHKEYEAN